MSELAAFVQQDLEIFTEDNVPAEQVSEEISIPEAATTASIDFAALSQRIASDRQYIDSAETQRDFDEDLLNIFLEEADELLVGIDEDLNTWSKKQDDTTSLNNLMRHLHTLKGGANMITASHIGSISHELESIYERIIRQQIAVTPALIQIIRLVQDNVSDRIQSIRDEGIDYPAVEAISILQNIQALVAGQAVAAPVETSIPVVEFEYAEASADSEQTADEASEEIASKDTNLDLEPALNLEDKQVELTETETLTEPVEVVAEERSEEDELKSIVEETFLEESEEILDNTEKLLNQWFDQRSDRSLLLQYNVLPTVSRVVRA